MRLEHLLSGASVLVEIDDQYSVTALGQQAYGVRCLATIQNIGMYRLGKTTGYDKEYNKRLYSHSPAYQAGEEVL